MKYIIYNQGHLVNLVVLFPRLINHDDMARTLDQTAEIESAGFVTLNIEEGKYPVPKCYGKSVSLNKVSREQDSEIVRKYFYEHGY